MQGTRIRVGAAALAVVALVLAGGAGAVSNGAFDPAANDRGQTNARANCEQAVDRSNGRANCFHTR